MPLTVDQALHEIKVLAPAKVVAGEGGLNRVIRWTHIVDHPDVVPWVQAGYLLLTTAFALMLNPDSQMELIPKLAEKGLAGMMVNVGRYMGEIPATMVEAAQRLDFPLISLPWEVDFTEVTHGIHERIINEQYYLSEKVFHIHNILTQIVIDGGGLDMLASRLAELLERSITIEDSSLSLLAYKSMNLVDNVRERSIAEGKTPDELKAFQTDQGLYEMLRQDPRPRKVDPIPELGLTMERVIAPIMVGSHLLGYIWVIAADRPLTELDFLVIERGANVAALIMSREQAVYEAEQRIKAELFDSLLDPQSPDNQYNLSATFQKLNLASGYQIMIVEHRSSFTLNSLNRFIEQFFSEQGIDALLIERGGRLVAIVASGSGGKVTEIAHQLLERAAAREFNLSIGVGAHETELGRFREAYEQAAGALKIGKSSSANGDNLWSYEKLGYLNHLLKLSDEYQRANIYVAMVANLAAYDDKHQTELVKTLEIYLDHLSNIHKAAEVLYIHRNTLYQRLKKIEDICPVNLSDPAVLYNLYVAMKDWRMRNLA